MEEAVMRLKKRRPVNGGFGNSRSVYESLTFLRKRLSIRSTKTESTSDVDEAIRRFRDLGGPQCLLRIVRDYSTTTTDHVHSADCRVLDVALSVLGNCSLDYETRKIVGRLQGVQHVVKILENFEISKLSLLNRTCRTLANLALDDRLADDILKSDAMKFIVELLESLESPMSTAINSVDVHESSHLKQSAVRSIRVLAATPARRDCVVRHGAVRVLGKMLVACSDESCEDEELVVCILRALVVISVNCSLEFTEQMQSCINGLEMLVKLTSSDSEKYRDPSLNVLANLSCQASMRPLLGNAGAIDSLVLHLADGSNWETTTTIKSPGWQWAVDALCQCTRESVNRVKVRESNGGLGHLVRLLGEPFDGRLWLCGLSALINFFYDDLSFSRLVDDEPLVDALLEKFTALAKRENAVEHDAFNRLQTAPTQDDEQNRGSAHPNEFSSSFTDFDRGCTSTTALHNSHVCCFSPENSPPYLTPFTSFPLTSSHRNQGTVSPSGMSPARDDFSPEPSCDVEEFCYSPVYESEDSDEDDDGGDNKNDDINDADACKSSENSVVSESQPDVADGQTAIHVDHSMGSRSPIGDILLLLSKLSLEEKPRPRFFCLVTLDSLVDYVVTVESPHPRAKRILNRIARNPLCFERLVTLRWIVSLRKRLAVATIHSSDECTACESIESFGLSLLNDLKLQAESPFGVGVLLHLILAGKNSDEKVSALLTTVHLVRVPRILHKILFLDADGLTQVMTIMADSDHVDHKVLFDGFIRLAQEIVSPLADPVDACPTVTMATMHCHYEDALLKSDDSDADLVRLRTDGGDHQLISAHRSVLSNACDVFSAMFAGNFVESRLPVVVIGNASFEALQYVVHHIYSCSGCPAVVNLTTRVLLECLELANKLLMCDVKTSVCECLMRSGRHLPSPKVYSHAKLYDCPSLSLWVMRQVLSPKFSIERRFKVIRKMMSAGFLVDVSHKLTDAISVKTRTSLNMS